MGWTAAAIVGSAIIGGIASSKAASAQKSAAAGASGVSQAQYEQTREDLAPWRQIGGQAINELSALYGLPGEYPGGSGPVIDQAGAPVANDFIPALPGERATPINALARLGRGGDTRLGHLTEGEAVVPESVAASLPGGSNALWDAYRQRGMEPGRYIVGGPDDSVNPVTGAREFYAASGMADPGAEAGGFAESGGFGAGDFGDSSGNYGQGPESQNVDNRDGGGGRNALNRSTGRLERRSPAPAAPAAPDPYAGLPEGYFSQENALARFYESPDYRISFDEGAKALEASAAARGGLFSGNTATALTRYGADYGNRLYNQYANRLSAFAGFGQTAATNTGQFGAYAAGQQGNALLYGGAAAAQGWEGMANAINAGAGNMLYYNYLNQQNQAA